MEIPSPEADLSNRFNDPTSHGTAGALGVLTVAGVGRPLLILLPLLADPGCIPLFIELIALLVKDGRRK